MLERALSVFRSDGVSNPPLALDYCAVARVCAGEFTAAEAMGDEARAISVAISNPDVSISRPSRPILAGWRGRQADALRLIEASDSDAARRGEGIMIGASRYATAVLYNGLGHYKHALDAAQQAVEHPCEVATSRWALPEQIEAATRTGKAETAARALEQLSESTRASGTDWALGIEARSRALISEGETAESLYREAIGAAPPHPRRRGARPLPSSVRRMAAPRGPAPRRPRAAAQRARAVQGVRHGGVGRTRASRAPADRRARPQRTPPTRDDLTPQEAQICRLASDGATNQQIAAQLFLSPSTIDYHLRKAFRKLGVNSRRQLKQQVIQPTEHVEPAAREP